MAAANVILLEVQPRSTATGARTTVRLGGGGANYPLRYGGNQFQPGIPAMPTIIAGLDYSGTDMGQGAVPQALQLEWAGSKAALDGLLALHWAGAPFTLYQGAENAAGTLPAVLLTGTVLRATISDSVLQLAMADPAADLQRPIVTATFAGTGTTEGPAEWEGRVKRRAWGYVFNVEGFAIDTANNVYSFTDPAFQLNAISEVRDRGVAYVIEATVAWQGSVAATYAALQAASVASGKCKIAPSIGMVKVWTRPAGILAADLQGEASSVTGGFVSTPAKLANAIVAARSGPAFTAGTVTAAELLRTAPCGFLADDLQTTLAQALDFVLGGVSLFWVLDTAGTIRIGEWTFGASQGTFTSDHVDRAAIFPPVKQRKLGYRRNYRKMSAGDLAAILTYGDGTPIDNLQPAEASATVGARLGTNLRDSGGTVQTDANVKNASVSIGADGALAGAGGGQVTIGGLGYAGDLAATTGDNLIVNPTLAVDTAGWVLGGGMNASRGVSIFPTPGFFYGTTNNAYAYANGSNSSSSRVRVDGGQLYFIDFWIFSQDYASNKVKIEVEWFGADGVTISTDSKTLAASANNTVTNVADILTAPPLAAFAKVLGVLVLGNPGAGNTYWGGLRFSRTENRADVTSYIDSTPAQLTVPATSAGVPLSGQLPKTLQMKLWRNGQDVTAGAAWTVTTLAGSMAATIGAATGLLSVDVDGLGKFTSGSVRVTATYKGTVRNAVVPIVRQDASVPTGGGSGGGTSATGAISGTVNSTSPTVISPVLTMNAGSGGQADLSAVYSFTSSGLGSKSMTTRWQRNISGTWTDVGSAKAADAPYVGDEGYFEEGQGAHSETITGLGAGTTGLQFRLTGYTPSGTVARYPYGDAGATGS